MANVILFHSAYGLRELERMAAERFAAAGHKVFTPDLYEGLVAGSIHDAMALKDAVGWSTICARAAAAVAGQPATAVLGGFSMGAGVAASLWPQRRETAGLLMLHGIFPMPNTPRPGLPVQLHIAEPDDFESEDEVMNFIAGEERAGSAIEVFRYRGAGHLFADPSLPDYNAEASELMWGRVFGCLSAL